MQLRKAEFVRVLYYESVYVGNVYARLDYRRTHQHLDPALDHVLHDAGELFLVHLAVRHGYGGAVQQLGYLQRGALNVVHTVVQVIYLPSARELAAHSLRQHAPVVLHDKGLDRKPVLRRLLYRGHIPYPRKRHVQRPRYRRGRKGQHVHLTRQLLDMFLVRDAEALFLVNYEQTQLLELYVLLQQSVRAYDQVAFAAL